jgi:hypothetical protein
MKKENKNIDSEHECGHAGPLTKNQLIEALEGVK